MTARILLALVYDSLQRASSNIANLTNKKHFHDLKYMPYKDAHMKDFLDEVNRRINLCDELEKKDIESQCSR